VGVQITNFLVRLDPLDNILESIYKAGLKISDLLTPEEVYASIVEEAIRLVKADYGSIFLSSKVNYKEFILPGIFFTLCRARRRGLVNDVYKSHKPQILNVKDGLKVGPGYEKIGD